MAGLYKATATIDSHMYIVKADEAFYTFNGEDTRYSIQHIIHPEDISKFKNAVSQLKKTGHNYTVMRARRSDGKYRWMLVELEYDVVEFNGEQLINVSVQDIANLEKKLDELNRGNAEYRECISLMQEILLTYDIDNDELNIFAVESAGNKTYFNGTLEACTKLFYDRGYVVDSYISVFEQFIDHLKNGTRSFQCELVSKTSDKPGLYFIKGKTVRTGMRNRKVIGTIVAIDSSTKERTVRRAVADDRDVGTDVLNKKAITEYVKNCIQNNPDKHIALGIVDLDNFKYINDTFGHMFGDEVLITAADILKDAIGNKGVVGRFGGDEMMIVIEDFADRAELRGILRTIRSNVEWAYKGKKDNVNLSCSIGVGNYPQDAKDYESLFNIADKALYIAKEKGKNRYVIYIPEMHENVEKKDVSSADKNEPVRMEKVKLVHVLTEQFLVHKDIPFYKVLQEVGISFELNEVSMYVEGDFSRRYLNWCVKDTLDCDAEYVKKPEYLENFDADGVFVIDSPMMFAGNNNEVYEIFTSQKIGTAIQYLIGTKENPQGMIMYSRGRDSRKWSELDITYLSIISKMIELGLKDR